MSSALWAGRLAGGLDPAVLAFTASLEVDRRLLPFDLEASAAHARKARSTSGCLAAKSSVTISPMSSSS